MIRPVTRAAWAVFAVAVLLTAGNLLEVGAASPTQRPAAAGPIGGMHAHAGAVAAPRAADWRPWSRSTGTLGLPQPPISTCFHPRTPRRYMEAVLDAQRKAWAAQAAAAGGGPAPFQVGGIWTKTATNPSIKRGDPITLTWTIVPDGTAITTAIQGESKAGSNLRAKLAQVYPGGEAQWMPLFQSIFDRWAALSGVTYVYKDESAQPLAGIPGTAGSSTRADLRIGGHDIDGIFGILAYNYFPNTGDMVIDTSEFDPGGFFTDTSNNSLGFRNTLAHEHGHGLGLDHTCPLDETKLMEPFLSTNFDGPQHDDILGAQRNYGDRFGNNNTSGAAADLGSLFAGTTTVNDVSIDGATEVDFYRFDTLPAAKVSITLRPVGSTYLEGVQNANGSCSIGSSFNSLVLRNLNFELRDTDGTSVLASGDAQAAGVNEVVSNFQLAGTGPYYIRVFGGDAVDQIQLYALDVQISPGAPQLRVWTGAGGDANWTTAANWSPAFAPSAGDILEFPDGALQKTNNNDFPAFTAFTEVRFTGAAAGYVLSGNSVVLIDGLTDSSTAGSNIVNFGVRLFQPLPFNVSNAGGSLEFNGGVVLNGNALTVNAVGSISMSSDIGGAGGLIKTGAGNLTLIAANTYTGTTQVNAGLLILQGGARLGAADGTAGNGTTVASGAGIRLEGASPGNEPLSIAGDGPGGIGALIGDSGTWSGPITLAGNTRFAAAGGNYLSLTGVVSGPNDLLFGGDGTVVLGNASSTNSFTGDVTVGAFGVGVTLQLSAPGAVGVSRPAVVVNAGSVFDLNGFDTWTASISGGGNVSLGSATLSTDGNGVPLTGVVSGSGSLVKIGSGTLVLGGANTYTGVTTIQGGILRLGVGGSLSDSTDMTVASGAVFDLNGNNDTIRSIQGAGNVTLGAGTLAVNASGVGPLTLSGVVSGTGGFSKSGNHTLILSAANSYTGMTTLSAGSLIVDGSLAGPITVVGGTLAGGGSVGAVTATNGVVAPGSSAGTLTTGGLTLTAPAVLRLELFGPVPGVTYDRLVVNGAVSLGGATLEIITAEHPAGTAFTIVADDGVDAVGGTFAGLPQAGTFDSGVNTFQLDYTGGDGNDIVLTVVLSARPDFNDDGRNDLLWFNSSSKTAQMWLMDGATATAQSFSTAAVSGKVVACGDFDGDGDLDLLFLAGSGGGFFGGSSTTTARIQFMDGTTPDVVEPITPPFTLSSSFTVLRCDDFDRDGKADILWRNKSTGAVILWLMDGSTVAQSITLPLNAASNMTFLAAADFDGDGDLDVLWQIKTTTGSFFQRTTTLTLRLWELDRETFLTSHDVANPVTGLTFGGVGDFDGDGVADIVFRNASTKQNFLWLMDLNLVDSVVALPDELNSSMKIISAGDYDGDGEIDILWQNTSTKAFTFWKMNGTAFVSATALNLPAPSGTGWTLVHK